MKDDKISNKPASGFCSRCAIDVNGHHVKPNYQEESISTQLGTASKPTHPSPEQDVPVKGPRLQKKEAAQLRNQSKDAVIIDEYKTAIAQLRAQLKEEKRQTANAIHNSEHQQRSRVKATQDAEIYKSRANELHIRLDQANRRVERTANENSLLQDSYKTVYSELLAYKKNYDNVRNQLCFLQEEQAAKICNVQMTAFKRFDDPAWVPLSNAQAEQKLRDIELSIKKWAKSNALTSLKLLSDGEVDEERLLAILRPVVTLEDEKLPKGLGDDRAWVLLQAALIHKIYTDIFEQPFFFLGEWLSSKKPGEDDERGCFSIAHELGILYDDLEYGKRELALRWMLDSD
jgi:hypothetical protein